MLPNGRRHSPLAGTYNRSRYLDEAGEVLQRFADWLKALERPFPVGLPQPDKTLAGIAEPAQLSV
jgi:hypothetical protein